MEDDYNDSADEQPRQPEQGSETNLTHIIARLVAERDARHEEVDDEEIVQEIDARYGAALQLHEHSLALRAVRNMVRKYTRRLTALDPDQEDGPQFAIPGLERIPTHTAYRNTKGRVVSRHTLDATVQEHRGCLSLKRTNTARCLEREQVEERIIDLLESTGCFTLHDYMQKHGRDAA